MPCSCDMEARGQRSESVVQRGEVTASKPSGAELEFLFYDLNLTLFCFEHHHLLFCIGETLTWFNVLKI